MQKYRLANGSDLLANASHTHRTSIHTSLLFGHSSLSGVTPAPPRHPSLTRARATTECAHPGPLPALHPIVCNPSGLRGQRLLSPVLDRSLDCHGAALGSHMGGRFQKSQKLFVPRIPVHSVNILESTGMRGIHTDACRKIHLPMWHSQRARGPVTCRKTVIWRDSKSYIL